MYFKNQQTFETTNFDIWQCFIKDYHQEKILHRFQSHQIYKKFAVTGRLYLVQNQIKKSFPVNIQYVSRSTLKKI